MRYTKPAVVSTVDALSKIESTESTNPNKPLHERRVRGRRVTKQAACESDGTEFASGSHVRDTRSWQLRRHCFANEC